MTISERVLKSILSDFVFIINNLKNSLFELEFLYKGIIFRKDKNYENSG